MRGDGAGGRCGRGGAGQGGGMRTYAELPRLMTMMTGDEKHGPSATSTLDVLWVLYDRITEPLIVFYEAVMRREWTRLERGDTAGAWRNSRATFLSQVAGPHFETICRNWAMLRGAEVFGEASGEVAAGVVADPLHRDQIQVDVAVFAPDEPGRPRRVLSLGEAKWDKVMGSGHLGRLRRAKDLLAVKGYDTSATRLTCYSAEGFHPSLSGLAAADPLVQLIGLDRLYG